MAAPLATVDMASPPVAVTVAQVERWYPLVDLSAVKHHVSQALLEAVMTVESGGDPDAFRVEAGVGDASFGLMQVLLRTARALGFTGPPRYLFQADVNIDLGAAYLSDLLQRWPTVHAALVAYNAGPVAAAFYVSGRRGFRGDHYADTVERWITVYLARHATGAPHAP